MKPSFGPIEPKSDFAANQLGASALEECERREWKPSRSSWILLTTLPCFLGGCESEVLPQGEAAVKAAPGPTRLYYGISACAHCHRKPVEPPPVLCRCIEAAIWETEDKHKEAFQVLRGERARRMGELLSIKGAVWEEKSCISCHGVFIEDNRLRH